MRIVIVEDEAVIQDGLKRLIKKINPDYQVAAVAEDGLEGLEAIWREAPDLVITDVRMPNMDGLQMLEKMKERGLQAKVIILSAYSDFEYARTAMRFGVNDYILKPVSVHELKNALQLAEAQIEKQKKQENASEANFLDNILYGVLLDNRELKPEIREILEQNYGISPEQNFIVSLFYFENAYEQRKNTLEKKLNYIFSDEYSVKYVVLSFPKERQVAVILYSWNGEDKLKNRLQAMMLREKLADGAGWAGFAGISQLSPVMQKLRENLDYTLVLGSDTLICYPQILKIQTTPFFYDRKLEDELRRCICLSQADKIQEAMKSFEEYCFSGEIYLPEKIKESYVRFIWSILEVVKEVDYEKIQAIEQQKLFDQVMSAVIREELNQVLVRLYQLFFQNDPSKEDNYLIQRTKNMIHEFYAQGITLEEIARRLNITPEYLGTQFRIHCNVNFSTYMKEYRVQKAKELLLGSQLKLYEVAQAVGYTDSKYFAQVFKALTGESPNEYRKHRK